VVAVEHIMGMPVTVDVRDEAFDESALEQMFDSLRFADAIFSTYKEDSEISRVNRGELAVAAAHPDVREVLDRCEALRTETDGYFDMRAVGGDAIDPSGLVKGWAVDRAASILDGVGVRNYAVNVAGDMRLRGRAGVSASSIRWSRTRSRRSSRQTSSPLRRRAPMRVESM
jgi:FAD:protein FMN transferase